MKWVMLGLTGLSMAASATAQNPMKACGVKYQAAKADGSLSAGQTWPQFLAACRATLSGAVTPVAPGAAATAAPTRIQRCAAQYYVDKGSGTLPAGQRWPQYYSACSAKLKS